MKLAVDVGYGFTKALADTGSRALFPSAACPAPPDVLAGVVGPAVSYRVRVRRCGGEAEEHLVGRAALASVRAEMTLSREKPAELHDLLLLTAAYLAGAGVAELAVGLPLAFYRAQKETLAERLRRLSAWVGADGGEERWVAFSRVAVVPQGAGVVLAQDGLGDGLYGVLDVGEYTTDYLLFEVRDGDLTPVLDACGSAEAGAGLVKQAVAQAFAAFTGEPLPASEVHRVTEAALSAKPVAFRGRELDLSRPAARAVKDAARLIAGRVQSAWGPRAAFAGRVLLAGGGALLFGKELAAYFPAAEGVPDPVFANCRGYLAALD
ncbi:MAG: hypothetical protein ACPLRW_11580 [Moorellales bacterium]